MNAASPINPQPLTMTSEPSTINLKPVTLNHPQPETLNPKPYQEQENQTLPGRRTLGKYNDDEQPGLMTVLLDFCKLSLEFFNQSCLLTCVLSSGLLSP